MIYIRITDPVTQKMEEVDITSSIGAVGMSLQDLKRCLKIKAKKEKNGYGSHRDKINTQYGVDYHLKNLVQVLSELFKGPFNGNWR